MGTCTCISTCIWTYICIICILYMYMPCQKSTETNQKSVFSWEHAHVFLHVYEHKYALYVYYICICPAKRVQRQIKRVCFHTCTYICICKYIWTYVCAIRINHMPCQESEETCIKSLFLYNFQIFRSLLQKRPTQDTYKFSGLFCKRDLQKRPTKDTRKWRDMHKESLLVQEETLYALVVVCVQVCFQKCVYVYVYVHVQYMYM